MSARTAARLVDWSLLILCNLIWASQFVLAKLVQEQMGPIFATLLPMAIATICLIPLVRRQQARRGRRPSVGRADIVRFAFLGVFGQIAAQLGTTWGGPLGACFKRRAIVADAADHNRVDGVRIDRRAHDDNPLDELCPGCRGGLAMLRY